MLRLLRLAGCSIWFDSVPKNKSKSTELVYRVYTMMGFTKSLVFTKKWDRNERMLSFACRSCHIDIHHSDCIVDFSILSCAIAAQTSATFFASSCFRKRSSCVSPSQITAWFFAFFNIRDWRAQPFGPTLCVFFLCSEWISKRDHVF